GLPPALLVVLVPASSRRNDGYWVCAEERPEVWGYRSRYTYAPCPQSGRLVAGASIANEAGEEQTGEARGQTG
ncbi:hypothetical protein B0T09DRAFT_407498, partial [Sordaria sp. MPI-SDFR-AT-0083]